MIEAISWMPSCSLINASEALASSRGGYEGGQSDNYQGYKCVFLHRIELATRVVRVLQARAIEFLDADW